jgi:hypothetical protein
MKPIHIRLNIQQFNALLNGKTSTYTLVHILRELLIDFNDTKPTELLIEEQGYLPASCGTVDCPTGRTIRLSIKDMKIDIKHKQIVINLDTGDTIDVAGDPYKAIGMNPELHKIRSIDI